MSIDIDWRVDDEYRPLSNLMDNRFVFDGEHIRSPECILQSIKVVDAAEQATFWQHRGMMCKKLGRKIPWQGSRLLWWKGKPMDRDGPEYQEFLDRMYGALFTQNAAFREALILSGTEELTHTIGSTDPVHTILTQEEFLSRLYTLRDMAIKKPS